MGATLFISGHAAEGRTKIDLYNWDADEPVIVTSVQLALIDKGKSETFTPEREISVQSDREEHIDITDSLKALVGGDGQHNVQVTVTCNPDYALSSKKRVFIAAVHHDKFLYFGFDHFSN